MLSMIDRVQLAIQRVRFAADAFQLQCGVRDVVLLLQHRIDLALNLGPHADRLIVYQHVRR